MQAKGGSKATLEENHYDVCLPAYTYNVFLRTE